MITSALTAGPGTCIEPEPVFGIEDYNGPFQKLVVHVAGKPDIKTVHAPHSKPGSVLCSLHASEKFKLFVQDTFEPVTFGIAAFNAGIAQAENDDPGFGQGAEGYGPQVRRSFRRRGERRFFGDLPVSDAVPRRPRYYRMGHGNVAKRMGHAVEHAFVTHRIQDGSRSISPSGWAQQQYRIGKPVSLRESSRIPTSCEKCCLRSIDRCGLGYVARILAGNMQERPSPLQDSRPTLRREPDFSPASSC